MNRPWRSRIWFSKPDWRNWDWADLKKYAWKPFSRGGDEFNYHTLAFGFPWTGQLVIAHKRCPIEGCFTDEELAMMPDFDPAPEWPIDVYGWDHTKSDEENERLLGWND